MGWKTNSGGNGSSKVAQASLYIYLLDAHNSACFDVMCETFVKTDVSFLTTRVAYGTPFNESYYLHMLEPAPRFFCDKPEHDWLFCRWALHMIPVCAFTHVRTDHSWHISWKCLVTQCQLFLNSNSTSKFIDWQPFYRQLGYCTASLTVFNSFCNMVQCLQHPVSVDFISVVISCVRGQTANPVSFTWASNIVASVDGLIKSTQSISCPGAFQSKSISQSIKKFSQSFDSHATEWSAILNGHHFISFLKSKMMWRFVFMGASIVADGTGNYRDFHRWGKQANCGKNHGSKVISWLFNDGLYTTIIFQGCRVGIPAARGDTVEAKVSTYLRPVGLQRPSGSSEGACHRESLPPLATQWH